MPQFPAGKTVASRQRRLGFTLVEMMVTVGVGAIMMAVAVPQLRTLVASNKITTEANRIVAGFNYARTEAVRRNQPVYICSANLNTNSMSISGCLSQQTSSKYNWGYGQLVYADNITTGTMGSYDSGEAIKSFSFYGEMNNASAINLVMSTSPVASVNQLAFGSDGRLLDGNSRKLLLQDTSNNLCRVILVSGSGRSKACDTSTDNSCGACS
ncbi:GspH/FimT family pseudopilin [Aquitalea sp. ASV11]|uniref:GspH/FimT family pseudopilin n=1 Tax=Aquitalea sp. ASV11 TaxID=2795103 RepID=UPI0018EA9DA7|nr:GspH/FimT family pseudopilin [Aquitalea sp. ASV11]